MIYTLMCKYTCKLMFVFPFNFLELNFICLSVKIGFEVASRWAFLITLSALIIGCWIKKKILSKTMRFEHSFKILYKALSSRPSVQLCSLCHFWLCLKDKMLYIDIYREMYQKPSCQNHNAKIYEISYLASISSIQVILLGHYLLFPGHNLYINT